ncbi:3-hydroxyacyl-CoA dehydrogenase family protein [Halegenticoccus tardaugens]|uniref:3-hydroxyacyl-CoA dehydrogenase family protein n=1 Tax=Halegenticoccus tardaugens TaxID=2071624 RepID=UPI00100B491B|nr:3-hydroxyacyl-CoA dehydrogenase NAD-binding domain-containing protein [Halegenticoccus tardaugens]
MTGELAIIGAGNMGHGLAAHFALYGWNVTLIDHRQSNLDNARERIRKVVRFHDEEGLMSVTPDSALKSISFTLNRAAGVSDAEVVIETVTEDLDVKQKVFAELADLAQTDAILATNTSGIPITDIAADNEAADRIVGCHWWYPPYLLRPVEVIRGKETRDETVNRMVTFLEAVDRTPVVVERDIPGFVWNRIQFAVIRECMHLAVEGVASIEDINMAVRDGYARRTSVIGPFETTDIAGLDLFKTNARNLYPHLCDSDEPSILFEEYLQANRGGIEDGAGFFKYDTSPKTITHRRDKRLAALKQLLDE